MGVLLYALLCGFLPFDDENIASLYRKIQSGIYEKPPWLSQGSLEMLNSMLQTDPKKRVTVKELLQHPWLMDGYEKPVKWQSRFRTGQLDESIVGVMAEYYAVSRQTEAEKLLAWHYGNHTIVYLLLLARKQIGKDINILPPKYTDKKPLPDLIVDKGTPKRSILGELNKESMSAQGRSLALSPRALHTSMEGGLDNMALLNIGTPPHKKEEREKKEEKSDLPVPFERTGNRNRASERYHIPHKKAVKDQQKAEDEKENTASNAFATPTETPRRQKSRKIDTPVLSPSRSMDTGMNEINKTPARGGPFATPSNRGGAVTPGKGTGVFGSIERGLDKMKNMLTPRKRLNSSDGPVLVSGKGLCNVSTTNHHNPDAVLNELTRALMFKGIQCQQKGYILRGKITDPSGMAKLSFELEVCRIPNLNVVGIRRKRLKGDAWCYKKVCEEVLKMTAVSAVRQ